MKLENKLYIHRWEVWGNHYYGVVEDETWRGYRRYRHRYGIYWQQDTIVIHRVKKNSLHLRGWKKREHFMELENVVLNWGKREKTPSALVKGMKKEP